MRRYMLILGAFTMVNFTESLIPNGDLDQLFFVHMKRSTILVRFKHVLENFVSRCDVLWAELPNLRSGYT